MNSELAFNLNGEPFDVPANAVGWRVRRMKSKGAPEVVYGRNGLPLVLPIEADLDDVRADTGAAGRYRLDPVDEANRPIANAPAGYVYVHEQREAPAAERTVAITPSDNVVIEAMRMNAEIARSVVDRFPQMVEAAATLLRAADGAGLPKREPRELELDEDDDVEAPAQATSPTFELINNLVAQVVPMVMTGFVGKKINVGSAFDWRKAAAEGKQKREQAPVLDVSTHSEPTQSSAELPPIDPKTMSHFIAIQSALGPEEAALARQLAAELTPIELRAWFDDLSKRDVAQAVQKIRGLLAGNTEVVS
jgi:hypothetical protein